MNVLTLAGRVVSDAMYLMEVNRDGGGSIHSLP